MPWCPNCRYEYVHGVQNCTDCGAALVDEEPTVRREKKPKKEELLYAPSFQPRPIPEGVEAEQLITASTRTEADELESLLVEKGISVHREFLGGKRVTGFALLVPVADLDKAAEVLEKAGVLSPVDEELMQMFEETNEEATDAAPGEARADDMNAYRKAAASLPKGYPSPADFSDDGETALLVTVSTTFEADRIEAAVKMEGIPVWRRNRGAGTAIQSIWGGTHLGVDLLVPEELLPVAAAAVERMGLLPEAVLEDAQQLDPLDDSGFQRRRSVTGWVLLVLFGGGAILAALGGLGGLFYYLWGLFI